MGKCHMSKHLLVMYCHARDTGFILIKIDITINITVNTITILLIDITINDTFDIDITIDIVILDITISQMSYSFGGFCSVYNNNVILSKTASSEMSNYQYFFYISQKRERY